ncbi:MAG TPA: MerR family transcriptional regulator [bacterium]
MKRQHTQQPTHPVFTVGVAGSLVGVSPQTLRKWERHGLLSPVREGHQRRRLYSWRDIERAQQIRYLVIRKHIPLRDVKLQLRLASVRKAPAAVAHGDGRVGAPPLVPRLALAIPR